MLFANVAGVATRRGGGDRLLWASMALAFLPAPAWLVLQAGEMAGASDLAEAAAAAPTALFHTGFGHALLLRLALLALALPVAARRGFVACLVACLLALGACLAQVDMGHAAAPDASWQALAAGLHVIAAGAWIGALLPLLRALRDAPLRAARRFSLVGMAAVAVLAGSGVAQAFTLVGGLPGLLGTTYGLTILLKCALLGALLVFAAINRLWLSPALGGPRAAAVLRRLRLSVGLEAGVGAVAVLVAASLAGLPPGAHEQPVWPLSWQPSLDAWDDPDIAGRVRTGLLLLAIAVPAAVAAAIVSNRRARAVAAAVAIGAAVLGAIVIVPQIRAFVMPAYPSSFFESPTGFTKASVATGAPLYASYCVSCHGRRGYGDGPAVTPATQPAPLTGFHLLERSDGEMFWILTAGIAGMGGKPSMPGFANALSDDERWALIDYVRTLAGAEPNGTPVVLHRHH